MNITCDLNPQMNPLYWKINGLVYEFFQVPEIFQIQGYETLNIPEVDRSMNGSTFQCFTVDPNEGAIFDNTTILRVISSSPSK